MTLKPAMLLPLLLALPGSAVAQDPLGWNSQRALDLISRARVRREMPRGDSTLRNYQSKATGFVYFYLDRPGSDERTLVRVDQIAIDLFFKRPNLTKQRIVGMRDANRLPNKMYYHLDHLTVVQNGLGDVIKIGDGDEVRDVPHPAAPGADTVYDYRLADSVTLQLGGDQPNVRVYEIQVRPKRTNRAAFIGSLYVDRAEADIVRLTFTFTPASYVDRRLDYINISLDNGLFGGKYWLPNEQSVEIRRQIPELDFAAGSVIKGRIHVANYQFNANIPDSIFYGRPVSAVSEEERKAFAFPQDIYSDLNTEGLAPPLQMEDLRARAAELVREKYLSGLPPIRLYVPNASSVMRRNDLEGWYAGAGVTYVPSPTLRADLLGGYAFRAEKPELVATLRTRAANNVRVNLSGYLNQPREISPVAIAPGVLNTLSVTAGNSDYSHLFFASGASLVSTAEFRANADYYLGVRVEEQRGPQVREGKARELFAGIAKAHRAEAGFDWAGKLEVSLIDVRQVNRFFRWHGALEPRWISEDKRRDFLANVTIALNSNEPAEQYQFYLGGRGTLPGYDLRQFKMPETYAVGRIETAQTIYGQWLRLHALGFAAVTPLPAEMDCCFESLPTKVRTSAGVGFGLFWDIIRIDVVKGARWQTLLSVRPDLWDML